MPDSLEDWIWTLFILIVGGISVNLISRKLEKPIDRVYEKLHGTMSARSQAKQQEIERILGLMESDSILVTTIYAREMRVSHAELIVMLTVVGLVLGSWFAYRLNQLDQISVFLLLTIAVLFMVILFYLGNRRSLISEAISRYEKAHPMGEIKKEQQ